VPAIKLEPKSEPADLSVGLSEQKSPSTAIDTKPELPKKKNPKASLKAQLALLTAPPSPGLVGKLRVHKSGRVSMLWGAPAPEDAADGEDEVGPLQMDVARGASCEFLQEVVVMKEKSPYGDEDLDKKGRQKGVAYSLGQVKGKYVVAPDFGKLIEASSGKKGKKKAKEGKGKEKMEV
jgi:DNA-directed RNA polymerase III subunit RPC4